MNVRFIDTSVLVNILDIPRMNQHRQQVIEEFKLIITDANENLILPLATIIETGNHIAHIPDGNIRRDKAKQFSEFLKKTASDEAPWQYYGKELNKDDLNKLAIDFPDHAMRETGIGDLSIIRAYEKYQEDITGINRIMIWSVDRHLQGYVKELDIISRRRNR